MKTITTQVIIKKFTFLACIFILTAVSNVSGATPGDLFIQSADTNVNPSEPAADVIYASLAATATEKSVFINWNTASETNNNYFEVERSLDMSSFKTVALVMDGFASEGTGKRYGFKEDAGDVRKGKVVYYRLKQIDKDGVINYSPVMKVQLTNCL